jgi:hypothetical protein
MALRDLTPAKCRLLRPRSSYWCHKLLSSLRDLPIGTAADPFMGQKRIVEKRWMEFFSDPSQWWDHRTAKVNEINFFMISLLSRKSQCCSWFS